MLKLVIDTKPCPFCGYKFFIPKANYVDSLMIVPNEDETNGTTQYVAMCPNCYTTSPPASTEDEAEINWNKRSNV